MSWVSSERRTSTEGKDHDHSSHVYVAYSPPLLSRRTSHGLRQVLAGLPSTPASGPRSRTMTLTSRRGAEQARLGDAARECAIRVAARVAAVSLRRDEQQLARAGRGRSGTEHHVSAFRIDPATGALTPHGEPIPLPSRPIHMTTDIPSENILVAFNNPSALRVYRINGDAHARRGSAAAGPDRRRHLRASGARDGRTTGWRSSWRAATITPATSPKTRARSRCSTSATACSRTASRSRLMAATASDRGISISIRASRGSTCRSRRENKLDMFKLDGDALSIRRRHSAKETLARPNNIRVTAGGGHRARAPERPLRVRRQSR